jgi:ABC-type branched-subunit amino acid transport system permease subunit
MLAGGFVAMLGGIVVGVPSLRVKGLYLAIATIAASFIAHFLFANLSSPAARRPDAAAGQCSACCSTPRSGCTG